ncbi:SidA/IucD/PvdA family monooxygenase (plasmid) [Rhizobium grahamii]|uniref:SidA/IucD/PvdA family monooxygenase n=1 Tax=Rhizobium grahamii TaxID=1120045 RepID=A0A5Q0CA54_9HYPH|nr:SidA/IucD/PvdA family monooxygenase [Rhizobium grahamii]QRM52425.1 SidA/IucD/PvdA family monooxygenase [Rhizobium sp. BG6]
MQTRTATVKQDSVILPEHGSKNENRRPVVAIIGGGVSGAGVAYHLAQLAVDDAPVIIVFEPRAELGKGLAYDTPDPTHRINVPAARMSLLPDHPEDFVEWIARQNAVADDSDALRTDGALFPRRSVFGAYVASALSPLVQAGIIKHQRVVVGAIRREGGAWQIIDTQGGQTSADYLVIATSHPAPSAPRALSGLAGHPRFVADSTSPTALDVVRPDDRVLIVGNGLTAADVVASLSRKGHHGPITSISRRGLRSRGHAPAPQEPFGDFEAAPAHSATVLLRHVRQAIAEAKAAGVTWHAVIDQVRGHGHEIWRNLPIAERCRIVRHVRPFWDVHRFRIAPQVEAAIDQAIASGRMEVLAASLGKVDRNGDVIEVDLKLRHGPSIERSFDAVVVTTGPSHGGILESQAWLADLRDKSHLQLDPTGLGISCSERSEAIDADGRADPSLLISGPLARGTFGELMGLPQITEHAVFVARELAGKTKATTR